MRRRAARDDDLHDGRRPVADAAARAAARPGWYGYQLDDREHATTSIGVTTPCGVPAETFKVETQPAVVTQVSSQTALAGSAVTDSVEVTGLAGETVTVVGEPVRARTRRPTR